MPRVKTYSAESGYVYEYQFLTHLADENGDVYCFATTQDRHSTFNTNVLLPTASIHSWESSERRTLTPTERYAIAKLALFAGFDRAEHPDRIPNPITVDAAQVRSIIQALDL